MHYNRWEIGEKPQPLVAALKSHRDYNRWEIGEKPQLVLLEGEGREIITDGRSGRNRNLRCMTTSRPANYNRWEIGEKPQPPR